MPDIIVTESRLTALPTQARPAQSAVASGGGKTPPATGTSLPNVVDSSTKPPELPELERLSKSLADFARSMNRDLNFRVDEASGRTVVTVIDGETDEVIRQIPSEDMLRMAEALEGASALLFDAQA